MFGIGETELVLIVLFAFLVFGPDKLPGMGRTLGRALRQFKNAQEGFTEVVQTNIVDPAAEAMSDTPKRPNRNRAAELDEDADIDAPEGEGGEKVERPKRAESFAERKKRLAAEKKAREEAEAAAAADADSDQDADAAAEAPSQSEETPEPEPTEAPKPTVADLYAMSGTRSKRSVGTDGEGPDAAREAIEEQSDERGAVGGDPLASDANDNEKEA